MTSAFVLGKNMPYDRIMNQMTVEQQQSPNLLARLKNKLYQLTPITNPDGSPIHQKHGSPIPFPHGESAIKKLEKAGASSEELEASARLVYSFFNEALPRTEMYKTPDGTEFLTATVDVTKIARKLLNLPEPTLQTPPDEKVFIFGSFQVPETGQFMFIEEGLHEYMKHITKVLDLLTKGETPKRITLTTLGSPSSIYGSESKNYALKTSAAETYFPANGDLYSQFIAENLKRELAGQSTKITLWGQSQGASLAAATAEKLIDANLTTRKRKERTPNKPYMEVVMVQPAADHDPRNETWGKIKAKYGVILDGIWPMLTSPELRSAIFGEATFINNVAEEIKLIERMDEEQKARKENTIRGGQKAIFRGYQVDKEKVKPIIIIGAYDTTTLDPEVLGKFILKEIHALLKKVSKRKNRIYHQRHGEEGYVAIKDRPNQITPLGKDIVGRKDGARTFVINTSHHFPFYRKNEISKRWLLAARALLRTYSLDNL